MTSTGIKKALLAQRIAAAGLSRPESAAPGQDRAHRGEGRERTEGPLSFAQRRMWLHQQIVPDSSAYNLCIEITFTGDVSEEALETALRAVQRRHEILRTTYHEDAGIPYQRVHPELPLALSRVDLTELPEPQRRARVGELARQHAARSYDLERDSSLRVVFVRESGSRLTVFLLVHHIAWDGLTFAAFSRDIERYYREALDGRVPAGSDVTGTQYVDHAAAEQRAWDDAHQAELEFWREQLRDAAPALFDGMQGERDGASGEDGRRVDRRMSASATAGLRRLARELDTTPYVVFLSCYLAVLSRFGSAADVSVGTAVLNREDPEIVDLIGNFGNIVVLRSEVRAGDSFRDLVARVKQVCAAGFAHQQYPYDKLVEKLNPDRTEVGGALFEAMLLFLTQRIEGPQLPGARTSWYRTDNRTAQHPLAVEVFLTDHMLVEATYSTAHLSGEVVGCLLAEMEGLLDAAAARPEAPLAGLMARAVVAPESAPERRPEALTVDMFRARATAEGREVALLSGDRLVSYAELDGRSDQLARVLRGRGVGPETRVAVMLPRSVDLVVALLAVLKAGGTVVPVDTGYPAERIGFMLADSAPWCVITTADRAGAVLRAGQPDLQAEIMVMEDHQAFLPGPRGCEPVALHPDHAAYVIYTSGSTGRPKGVVGTHGGLANRLAWAQRYWPVTPGQARIAKSSISFIDGLTELLAGLLGGARVVLADDRTATDVAALARLLSEHEVGQLTAVPSVVAALAEVPWADLSPIGRWVCSGEPLPMRVARSAAAMSPESVVTNSYGSSEVAGDVLVGEVDVLCDDSVTVGRPVPGAEVHLLDRFLNPVPPGVIGEVYVGGVQLARGYTDQAGLSAARFVADPYGGAGARLYRTGDLGRWTAQGRVQLLGRTDQQVKVRGVRVEPGEVEAVLAEHEQVGQAAVVAREDLPGGLGLVAYLVPAGSPGTNGSAATAGSPGTGIDTEEVRNWAGSRLPTQLV
ncbi:MAG: non-ribosomal peptide synthetase, partial [Pseudonocardiaceae bacterium]